MTLLEDENWHKPIRWTFKEHAIMKVEAWKKCFGDFWGIFRENLNFIRWRRMWNAYKIKAL
jgi:hypothetical protein